MAKYIACCVEDAGKIGEARIWNWRQELREAEDDAARLFDNDPDIQRVIIIRSHQPVRNRTAIHVFQENGVEYDLTLDKVIQRP